MLVVAAASVSTSDIIFLFAVAGIVLYVAARAAVDALTTLADPAPGRLAVGHFIPIAWTALLATFAGHDEIGIGLAFGTSVAALAMVLGILTCITTDPTGNDPHRLMRARAWPFVVPAAFFALLAGFRGSLTWWHALMLLLLGASVLGVWLARPRDAETGSTPATDGGGGQLASGVPAASPGSPARLRGIQLLLAVALGAAGGWLAYKAIIVADDRTRVATSGLIALAIVSPLLVLPLLGTGSIASHHGKFPNAVASLVALVLLNLCLLLPTVVLAHYARQVVVRVFLPTELADAATTRPGSATLPADIAPATTTTTTSTSTIAPTEHATSPFEDLRPMPFPLPVWRVDTVLLLVLGLLLVPVSLGRLTLRRAEGVALAFIYAAYLIVSTALAIRM